jgi:hypothetical protein
LVIQEQVDGLGNFHAPPPLFDGIMLMLIYREYPKYLGYPISFLSWQVNFYPAISLSTPIYFCQMTHFHARTWYVHVAPGFPHLTTADQC